MQAVTVAEANPPKLRGERIAILLLVALIALLAIKSAWVCDDAYITFRVVDNFVHGLGLRWNVAERVQAYTHPLWMFLMSALYAITREPYFTSMLLGLVLTSCATYWLALRGARDLPGATLALLALASSKAFIDFATSGLENPLLHLALVAACLAFTASASPEKRTLRLALALSAVALTRIDGVLLVLPLAAVQLWKHHGRAHLARWALGLAPIAAWEAFSLVYYGSLLPNTAYAKLSTGLPAGELAAQGLAYLGDSLRLDYVTLPVILFALAITLWQRERTQLALAAGIALHFVYLVKAGGDFMNGRFLTAPLIAAAFLIAHTHLPTRGVALATLGVLGLSIVNPASPLRAPLDYSAGRKQPEFIADDGVCDERGYWFSASGLFSPERNLEPPPYRHVSKGHGFAFHLRDVGPKVLRGEGIGYLGYWAGPSVHIVDPMGLSDALIARLPLYEHGALVDPDENRFRDRPWRIGHFTRRIPDGYLEAIADPALKLADPALEMRRREIELLTRAPIWSAARWRAILRNLP